MPISCKQSNQNVIKTKPNSFHECTENMLSQDADNAIHNLHVILPATADAG